MDPYAKRTLSVLAGLALAGPLLAQSNVIPGTDVRLAKMDTISALGREGVFPNGVNGVAMSTTACNVGTVGVPWEAPMASDHAFISFLVARELDGRFEQISDRSYVKHGFFALTDSYCSSCTLGPFGGGDVLGVGCSDTYSTSNNGDQYYLGPADEIDPWLGEWDPVCSHFDMGEPPVAPPQDCDGARSLSTGMASALNPVGHRINLADADLDVAGADFYFQAYYVIRGEPKEARGNNWGSREFTASWNGSSWGLAPVGGFGLGDFQEGSILQRWEGATLTSVGNGNDDGRVYVAAKVTGPEQGLYHYELAIQNRDNVRGVGAIRLPLCDGARVLNAELADLDDDPSNDWTVTVTPTELVASTADAPLRWNTIYNLRFDSDAAPEAALASLDQHEPGPGASVLQLQTATPTGLYNVYLGDGCATAGDPPLLYATGAPAQATLGNDTFALESAGNVPGEAHLLIAGLVEGSVDLGAGCTQWFGGPLGPTAFQIATTTADGAGVATFPLPVPNDPAFEGREVSFQGAGLNPAGGPIAGIAELTNGLLVRIGSDLPGCP